MFLSIFFLIYASAHLYVFLKARAALGFGLSAGVPLAAFMLVMTASPLIIYFSEKHHYEFIAKLVSYTGYTWMGLLFLFVCAVFIIDAFRFFVYMAALISHKELFYITPSAKFSFYIPLIISLTIGVYGYFEARNIHTERLVISTSKLPAGVDRLRIVQISDVHIGLIVREDRLRNILDKAKEANPDILISTGDLVDAQIDSLAGLAEMIKEINPRYGEFAITGNHEFYAGIEHAMDFTRNAGFVVLRGHGVTVNGLINIAGVDDPAGKPFGVYRQVSEKALLSGFHNNLFTLFLKHRPVLDKEGSGLFDLQLSGHTHKGQIFPLSLFTKLAYIIDTGYLKLGSNSGLYVSRGAGTWGPPMRFLAPPEVTIIDLKSQQRYTD